MSLRRRLFLLGGLTLLPVIGLLVYDQIDLRQNREQELHENALTLARDLAREMQRVIDGGHNVLFAIAQMPEIRSADAAACTNILAKLLPSYEGFLTIAAAHEDGTVFCASDRVGGAEPYPSVDDRYYFQQTLRTGAFTVGRFVLGRVTGTRSMHMATPYSGLDGAGDGVVFASISLDWLAGKMQRARWSEDRAFAIADNEGTILVRQPNHAEFVGRPMPPDIWRMLKDKGTAGTFDAQSPLDGVARIVGYVPPRAGPGGLYVGVGLGREAAYAPLNLATMRAGVGLALAAVVAVLVAHLAGQRLLKRPLEQLLRVTERWRQGDFSVRAPADDRTEFGQLGAAFNALAEELQKALGHKDDLLQELSHRVMNSLMSISAVIKLQARRTGSAEAAEQLAQAASRINSLALVYRQMHISEGVESVELESFLHDLCGEIERSLLGPDGSCSVEVGAIRLPARQAALLAIITNELMTNAVKHGGGAAARLKVLFAQAGPDYVLSVRNTGSLPRGFDPQTADGFGIAMVARLAGQLGGRLEALQVGGEVEFAVRFPVEADAASEPEEAGATAVA